MNETRGDYTLNIQIRANSPWIFKQADLIRELASHNYNIYLCQGLMTGSSNTSPKYQNKPYRNKRKWANSMKQAGLPFREQQPEQQRANDFTTSHENSSLRQRNGIWSITWTRTTEHYWLFRLPIVFKVFEVSSLNFLIFYCYVSCPTQKIFSLFPAKTNSNRKKFDSKKKILAIKSPPFPAHRVAPNQIFSLCDKLYC